MPGHWGRPSRPSRPSGPPSRGGGGGGIAGYRDGYSVQGGVKNYLGDQETVSGVPVKWQSGPDKPETELAYITKAEKDLILKKDLHGSLSKGPNLGPSGVMSLDSAGSGYGGPGPGSGGGGGGDDGGGDNWRENLQHTYSAPTAPPVTTGGGDNWRENLQHTYSAPTAPTVTTGGGDGPHRGDGGGWTPAGGNRQFTPFINPKGRRTITGGITGSNRFQKFISGLPKKGKDWFYGATEDWGDEELGNLFQTVANMPKYWDLPASLKKAIEAGKNIPFAAGLKTKEATEAIKKFGYEAMRPITAQSFKLAPTMREIEKAILGGGWNAYKNVEGVFGATGATMKDTLAKGAQYAKGAMTRGIGKAGDLAQVLSGYLDPGTYSKGYFDRGMLGNVEFRGPAGDINRALNLGPKSAQYAGKPITQALTNRIGSRLLPGANIGLGVASAAKHLQEGNYGQALMAGISAIPGPIGYAGLAGEMGLGALQNLGGQFVPNYQGQRGRLGQFNGGIVSVL